MLHLSKQEVRLGAVARESAREITVGTAKAGEQTNRLTTSLTIMILVERLRRSGYWVWLSSITLVMRNQSETNWKLLSRNSSSKTLVTWSWKPSNPCPSRAVRIRPSCSTLSSNSRRSSRSDVVDHTARNVYLPRIKRQKALFRRPNALTNQLSSQWMRHSLIQVTSSWQTLNKTTT